MAQFRVTSAVLQGAVYKLDGEYFTLGREPDNTLQIGHASISKHHAMLTIDKADFKLWDLHSTNGLIVNGEKTVLWHLQDGDRIVLGEVELRFELNGAAPVKPAEPVSDDRRVTQQMPILPPPAPPAKPLPPPARPPQPEVPKPTPPIPVVASAPAAATNAAPEKAPTGILSRMFRRQPEQPKVKPPPTKEEIRADLAKTFTKMGIEIPSPPSGKTPVTPLPEPPAPQALPEPPRPGLLARLFRKQPAKPIIEPPPTKEEIRANLAKTFIKMGVEIPVPSATVPTPVYSPPRPAEDEPTPTPPATPAQPPPTESAPAPAPAPPPPRSYRRLIFFGILIVGLVLVALGYSTNNAALKFLGIIGAITGFFSLIFALRFGGIIAPPRD